MRLRTPRWLLFLEGTLFLGALLVLGYKAATRILPLPANVIAQTRSTKRPDYLTQLLDNYRRYPDRYIRIDSEYWQYDAKTRVVLHSFALRNLATVAYTAIEVSFLYEGADGKTLQTRTLTIPGLLAAQGTMNLKKLKVAGIPDRVKKVFTTVSKASIAP